jgi:hypothetical protein
LPTLLFRFAWLLPCFGFALASLYGSCYFRGGFASLRVGSVLYCFAWLRLALGSLWCWLVSLWCRFASLHFGLGWYSFASLRFGRDLVLLELVSLRFALPSISLRCALASLRVCFGAASCWGFALVSLRLDVVGWFRVDALLPRLGFVGLRFASASLWFRFVVSSFRFGFALVSLRFRALVSLRFAFALALRRLALFLLFLFGFAAAEAPMWCFLELLKVFGLIERV